MLTNLTQQVLHLQHEISELQELTRSPVFPENFQSVLHSQKLSQQRNNLSIAVSACTQEPDFPTCQTNNISGGKPSSKHNPSERVLKILKNMQKLKRNLRTSKIHTTIISLPLPTMNKSFLSHLDIW